MKTEVRSACSSDALEVRELLSEPGYECAEASLSAQLDTYLRSESSRLLVAERTRGLAGLIAGHLIPLIHQPGNVGRITAFVVAANDRSHGVGKALLDAMESWFLENDCLRFEVTSGDHRARAHSFYEANGYVADERRFLKRCGV